VGIWLGAAEREGSWDKDGSLEGTKDGVPLGYWDTDGSSEGTKDGVPLGSKDKEGFAEGGS